MVYIYTKQKKKHFYVIKQRGNVLPEISLQLYP